ncbi:hypothetical protein [Nodosilinea sp. LEGE 07298]|uniref:hypothetical protein n=1 Tax=Nodosilinea sp. LEGE 07298 TaxID=2777970 RepID=UPI001880E2F0|nr:hypothetical protein [Nodosilinea sp. LEGE 07298]
MQTIDAQAETLRRNANPSLTKASFTSNSNLVIMGIGLLGLGRMGIGGGTTRPKTEANLANSTALVLR